MPIDFGKLFNDLCGINKKGKMNLTNPTQDDVKSWVEKADGAVAEK